MLRIRPKAGGGYTIPPGNLFRRGAADTRPEIYAMGLRNPFRIEVDPDDRRRCTSRDYSPDADEADPARGPAGQGKWTVITEPGNYGWPYCATAELPYVDYDFATGESGETFDCDAPDQRLAQQHRPHPAAGGRAAARLVLLRRLPAVPGDGGGRHRPDGRTGVRLRPERPASDRSRWRGRATTTACRCFYEWTRDYVKGMRLEPDGELASIEDVIPSIVTDNPMDMEFGPDGALYVLEYGDGFFAENPDAQLSRIDFIGAGGNRSPVPAVSATPTNGPTPLTVSFTSDGTVDPDGDRIRYAWDFDGDGDIDSNAQDPTHTYRTNGVYRATLTVTDVGGRHRGRHASADVDIVVGNQAPTVELVAPVAGQPFQFGDTVQFEVSVTDDQPVDCNAVTVTYILGHDDHGHPQTTASGCTGSIVTTVPGGHDPGEDELTAVFVAEYTDPGGDGAASAQR